MSLRNAPRLPCAPGFLHGGRNSAAELRRVKPGDRLAIPAATFNTFIDAARDVRQRQQKNAGQTYPRHRQGAEVAGSSVRNGRAGRPAPLQRLPIAVYIEKVYEDGYFSGLGIGT